VIRVRHLIVGLWLIGWGALVGFQVNPLAALALVMLILPVYWQVYVVIKEASDALHDRVRVPGQPATGKTPNPQGDKPERTEE
jgi:hypothetical protein